MNTSRSPFHPVPADGAEHVYAIVPQSIGDSWNAYCSCGWLSVASLWEFSREQAITELEKRVADHAPNGRYATKSDYPNERKSSEP